MSDKRNQLECLRRLHFLLKQGVPLGTACEQIIADFAELENLFQVEEVLIQHVAEAFAQSLAETYGSDGPDNLDSAWRCFVTLENIPTDIAEETASAIVNSTAAALNEEADDDDAWVKAKDGTR